MKFRKFCPFFGLKSIDCNGTLTKTIDNSIVLKIWRLLWSKAKAMCDYDSDD